MSGHGSWTAGRRRFIRQVRRVLSDGPGSNLTSDDRPHNLPSTWIRLF